MPSLRPPLRAAVIAALLALALALVGALLLRHKLSARLVAATEARLGSLGASVSMASVGPAWPLRLAWWWRGWPGAIGCIKATKTKGNWPP